MICYQNSSSANFGSFQEKRLQRSSIFDKIVKGVFRTLSNFKDQAFCENSDWISAVQRFSRNAPS